MEFFVLQNTRFNLVMKMAKTIANGIYQASLLYPKNDWQDLTWTKNIKHNKLKQSNLINTIDCSVLFTNIVNN